MALQVASQRRELEEKNKAARDAAGEAQRELRAAKGELQQTASAAEETFKHLRKQLAALEAELVAANFKASENDADDAASLSDLQVQPANSDNSKQ